MKPWDGMCEHHKPMNKVLGYIAHSEWMAAQGRKRLSQVKCEVCDRYLFPEELNEPDNEKANAIIRKSEAFLEAKAEKKRTRKSSSRGN